MFTFYVHYAADGKMEALFLVRLRDGLLVVPTAHWWRAGFLYSQHKITNDRVFTISRLANWYFLIFQRQICVICEWTSKAK